MRAVFLDRDGVLNRSVVRADGRPYPPASLDEFEILPGVPEACKLLTEAGFSLICVTNQPDVARGATSRDTVEGFHAVLRRDLPLHSIHTCFHDDRDNCACRKPRPGLLTQAASDYGIDLERSYMVGDRWRDIEAGRLANCKTVFLDYQYQEKQPATMSHRTDCLLHAAEWILLDSRGSIPGPVRLPVLAQ